MSDEDIVAVRERGQSRGVVRLAIVEGMVRPKARPGRKGANTLVKTRRLNPADTAGRLQLRRLTPLGESACRSRYSGTYTTGRRTANHACAICRIHPYRRRVQ